MNPATTKPEQRGIVRQVLSALPAGRAASVAFLVTTINRDFPVVVDEAGVLALIQWNHDKGFVDYRTNLELERDEWFLTARGKQQEGLA